MIVKADYVAKTVYEINYDELKLSGINTIAFDLDSTVMKSKSGVFTSETLQLFENLKKDFKLLIISNNSNMDYINKAQQQIDFPVVAPAKKPCTKVSKEFLNTTAQNTKQSRHMKQVLNSHPKTQKNIQDFIQDAEQVFCLLLWL